MNHEVVKLNANKKFLGACMEYLPSNCIINKGVTGCGGTTLELTCNRDSIILCPTIALVESKASLGYLGVTGNTNNITVRNYLMTAKGYKKILATYDALPRLIEIIPNYPDYFLLIDEYHLLFNDYSFRNKAIRGILDNFTKFKSWAFMTATPLKKECILEELKNIPQITYEWENAVPVRITVHDCYFTTKKLVDIIETYKDRNFHIFINSVSTIKQITEKLDYDYRVICSSNNKSKIKNFADITSPVKKLNFYTSCSFEGVDIYDPDGLCIILCDTNISTTVLDISTKIRQICGRLRDSKYKDECVLVLNSGKHRYADTNKDEFDKLVEKAQKDGDNTLNLLNKATPDEYTTMYERLTFEILSTMYLNKADDRGIYYDKNLRKIDIYNYNLFSEIYNNTISVIKECQNNSLKVTVSSLNKEYNRGLDWIIEKLKEVNKEWYTFEDLTFIFSELFNQHYLKWNKQNSIKNYFPEYKTKTTRKNGSNVKVYKFNYQ